MPREPAKGKKKVKLPFGKYKSSNFDRSELSVAVVRRVRKADLATVFEKKAASSPKRLIRLRKDET